MVDFERILVGRYLSDDSPANFALSYALMGEDYLKNYRDNVTGAMVANMIATSDTEAVLVRLPVITMDWDTSSPASETLWMEVLRAYETQQPLTLQFDSLMSRNVTKAIPISGDMRVFQTPTFPIVPWDYESGTMDWTGHVYVNMVQVDASEYTVDPDLGRITFKSSYVGPSDQVSVRYQWRASGIVTSFEASRLPNAQEDLYEMRAQVLIKLEAPTEVNWLTY